MTAGQTYEGPPAALLAGLLPSILTTQGRSNAALLFV
jgi:hypothetical protein